MRQVMATARVWAIICLLLQVSQAGQHHTPGPVPKGATTSGSNQNSTLRELADKIGFKIGATIAPPIFDEPQHQAILGREYNSAESVLQFRMVQPQEGRFNFTRMEREIAYARAHNMTLFGGPLIYKRQSLPPWM